MNQPTQRDKIKALLLERQGFWVPCYELAAIALQYNARVKELRDQGFEVDNSTQRTLDGTVRSWFMHPNPKPQQLDLLSGMEVPR